MRERPILMSGPMVRAILRDTNPKTQTRRVMKPIPAFPDSLSDFRVEIIGDEAFFCRPEATLSCRHFQCPYGQPGDRLWVRETWTDVREYEQGIFYRADNDAQGFLFHGLAKTGGPLHDEHVRWVPSIHMPRWASRITLEITGLHVERLQDISERDIRAEGIMPVDTSPGYEVFCDYSDVDPYTWSAGACYCSLWDSLNGKRPGCSWNDNPWVWVVEFKRVEVYV